MSNELFGVNEDECCITSLDLLSVRSSFTWKVCCTTREKFNSTSLHTGCME